MPRLPLAFLAAALLAGPALADGTPGPVRYGYDGPHRARVHRAIPHRPRRFVGVHGRVAPAPGPVYLAWPEPAEVRVPIYNRPSRLPPSW